MLSRRCPSRCFCFEDRPFFCCQADARRSSLDSEGEQEQLVDIIQTLLKDNSTMVLGSALYAFNQVCPDRLDLIHPVFRKLCALLADLVCLFSRARNTFGRSG
jgi:hypothetical protein